MTDALTDYLVCKLLHQKISDDLHWQAWLAMWERIGLDCGMDYLFWAARGEHFRPHVWTEPSEAFKAEARRFLKASKV